MYTILIYSYNTFRYAIETSTVTESKSFLHLYTDYMLEVLYI